MLCFQEAWSPQEALFIFPMRSHWESKAWTAGGRRDRKAASHSFSQGAQSPQARSPRRAASDKPQGSVALVKGVKEEPRRLAGVGCEISPSAPSRERSQWHRGLHSCPSVGCCPQRNQGRAYCSATCVPSEGHAEAGGSRASASGTGAARGSFTSPGDGSAAAGSGQPPGSQCRGSPFTFPVVLTETPERGENGRTYTFLPQLTRAG